jgi:hypothetical protein
MRGWIVTLCPQIHFSNRIFEAATRAFEGVMNRKDQMRVALITCRCFDNDDLAPIRQRDQDIHFIKAARLVMSAWAFDRHATGCDPLKSLFESFHLLGYFFADKGFGRKILNIEMKRDFHGLFLPEHLGEPADGDEHRPLRPADIDFAQERRD